MPTGEMPQGKKWETEPSQAEPSNVDREKSRGMQVMV